MPMDRLLTTRNQIKPRKLLVKLPVLLECLDGAADPINITEKCLDEIQIL